VTPRIARTLVDGKDAELWVRELPNGQPQPKIEYDLGSGFLVVASNRLFIVTASHVASTMSADSFVILKGQTDESSQIPLGQLSGEASSTNWICHAEADVAVLSLRPSPELSNAHLQQRFLPIDILETDRAAPSRNAPLTVLGFPLGMGSAGKFSPLTKQTHCASDLVALKRADVPITSTFFLLEDPSIEGYSGGPVLDISLYQLGNMRTTGSGTKLLGLVHGTSSDRTGGKLAMVVPSFYILETVQKAFINMPSEAAP